MRYLYLVLLLFTSSLSFAQLDITPQISPAFFAADEEITITYDVTGTSLSSLSDAYIWMWVPNADNPDVPSNVNPASSNPAATAPAKFTKFTNEGRTYFEITLMVTEFTNLQPQEIESVGMLLKGNDWSDGQTTDHIVEITNEFTLLIEEPDGQFGFYNEGDEINIVARTSELATIEIFVDDVLLTSESNVTFLEETHTIIADGTVHEIRIAASTGSESDEAAYSYTLTPQTETATLPAGVIPGINYTSSTTATLVLVAPYKENVFVIGDFNNWTLNDNYLMKKDGDYFWLELDNLTPGQEYIFQYLVDGELKIADPYTEKVSSEFDDAEIIEDNRYSGLKPYPYSYTNFEASFLQTDQAEYNWEIEEFVRPEKEDLVIYELLIRDFTDERTYNAVIDKLDYLDSLGINAIELMPVMEFEGNLSWGYNPSFMLATDKYYGTEDELRLLIDEAHKRGMAIILDIVLNHAFGRSPLVRLYNEGDYGAPTSENVWLNTTAKHDFNVGYDFNHESLYTQEYVDRVVTYWLEEYNIDGYRFDLSKGFTQKNTLGNTGAWGNYDASRIALLKRMADVIWAEDPTAYIILEHFAENKEEKELAEYGMMVWGNMNHTYRTAAKGSSTSLDWAYYDARGWSQPHLISYMESHDEERIMWDILEHSTMSEKQALGRMALNSVFFYTIPGPKMLWQFQEFGYDVELNDDRLGIKPTKWEYLEDDDHRKLFELTSSLIKLKTQTDYISSEYFTWDTDPAIKWININHPKVKISIVGNFSKTAETGNAHYVSTGTFYDYFTGEEIEITNSDEVITLNPGQFQILVSQPIENYVESSPVITSINRAEISGELNIYPNPTNGIINLNGISRDDQLVLYNVRGEKVRQIDSADSDINISDLTAGIYILQIKNSTNTTYTKIIKQ